jgi:hypothetical protein
MYDAGDPVVAAFPVVYNLSSGGRLDALNDARMRMRLQKPKTVLAFF